MNNFTVNSVHTLVSFLRLAANRSRVKTAHEIFKMTGCLLDIISMSDGVRLRFYKQRDEKNTKVRKRKWSRNWLWKKKQNRWELWHNVHSCVCVFVCLCVCVCVETIVCGSMCVFVDGWLKKRFLSSASFSSSSSSRSLSILARRPHKELCLRDRK